MSHAAEGAESVEVERLEQKKWVIESNVAECCRFLCSSVRQQNIVTATGTETPVCYSGFNPRLSSEEPDLGPPLTINFVVRWVGLEPRTPPSQPRVSVSAI